MCSRPVRPHKLGDLCQRADVNTCLERLHMYRKVEGRASWELAHPLCLQFQVLSHIGLYNFLLA